MKLTPGTCTTRGAVPDDDVDRLGCPQSQRSLDDPQADHNRSEGNSDILNEALHGRASKALRPPPSGKLLETAGHGSREFHTVGDMRVFDPYTMHTDARGLFCGITRQDWIREINYVETAAGEVRGNHYHCGTTEMFFIIEGRVSVSVRNVRTGETDERVFTKGGIFLVEPYELHTFHILADTKWINMLSKPVEGTEPDFHACDT